MKRGKDVVCNSVSECCRCRISSIAIRTQLNRWIVNVSAMMNAHIYVLTEFNYVQREILYAIFGVEC